MKTLIIFSSRDGQTHAISAAIASEIKHIQPCDILNIMHASSIEWEQYDRILIGASIRYGHFHPALAKFVAANLTALRERVSGFFSVNLTARKPEKRSPQTNAYTRKFLLSTPWAPDCCAVFAGALRYPRYSWYDRIMIQFIMRMTGGETNASKEVEYTDWQQVRRFAQDFAALPGKTA
ncbi:protoporphyrinogen oxidase [Erwinia sp. OLTSP20]|uniref:menaquinone-dependent protoporphyrinogen IX dehydrogenase n=1 Tax=unclassified Erwinia TaxID=2622719 RepID=UPI000C197C0C|nr:MULTISPECIES: menaquinone-dependent protoporphyrinogen IX dehydrogenase [unclassified Erwinia]PIJ50817.1 protoporphyrinogen oxidase [Erwinia sp. OAMSP11]PIJ72969.1 protoporphyrinogen oxidase [Erwinia sp. OLSSP12]PIJ81984.1 protoporphyrinogen oxidase [Erwinia sp. OLCASP19]PIJ84639.1 protoporphyrinogen oxidase [Erwinia sp. OLMTSP26]PIJ86988.1 protoporphyrinogen oxidase [Erwinia sp. OLMDSP33]